MVKNVRTFSAGSGDLYASGRYFTELTKQKLILYSVTSLYVFCTGLVALYEPFISLPCDDGHDASSFKSYDNPDYDGNPCRIQRHLKLLFLSREECSFARRLVASVVFGGLIGWERRQADRPAGIRTMALVSLGASLFTICSTFAFVSGPNGWDASRISAAIPSGVGFLGAGLIFKEQTTANDDTGSQTHVVHGLTTAASLWLSAAVGIACGGEMYFAASFGTAVLLLLLRFGPRHDEVDKHEDEIGVMGAELETDIPSNVHYGTSMRGGMDGNSETQSLVSDSVRARTSFANKKSRASLATMV